MKISVIGSGGWGTAIAILLAENNHEVTLWSWQKAESDALAKGRENKPFLPGIPLPEGIRYTADLAEAANADLLALATPSKALEKTVAQLAPLLRPGIPLVNLTKGLSDSQERFSEVIGRLCPKNPLVILSGPSHAEEVARKIPTTIVAASENEEAAQLVQNTFMSPTFRIYTSPDVIGVELGAALKNVIALCAGIVDGLGFGDNTKASLMTRGLVEMTRLGLAMGALPATLSGLSGVGDLIVTCTSMHSRNRRAGILIGQGKSVSEAIAEVRMVVEGVYAAESAYKLAQKYAVDMPIISAAYRVLFENADPREEVMALMMREKKKESELL